MFGAPRLTIRTSFCACTRAGRSTENIYGVIKICVAHGDFVILAAVWAFDLEPRLPRRT